MSQTPRIRISLAAVLTLVAGCGGDAPPSRPASPPSSPAPTASTGSAAAVTDAFGYYLFEDPDRLPAWAQSIDHLHLSNIELKGRRS